MTTDDSLIRLSQSFYMLLIILINKKVIDRDDMKAVFEAAGCSKHIFDKLMEEIEK